MKFGLPAVYFFLFFIHSNPAFAQSKPEDSAFYQLALGQTVSLYYEQLGDQSPIYNGSIYPVFDLPLQQGSPYFLTQKSSMGYVIYDSLMYPNLSLIYEDYRQFVVAIDQSVRLKLINERISAFMINGHHFLYVPADNLHKGIPVTGFYELLYPGHSRVLKHTLKKIREVLSVTEGITRFMDETDDYYFNNGQTYVMVNTKRELLNVMQDHKKEIQRFINKNNLNFKSDKENTLTQVAAYYDQLRSN